VLETALNQELTEHIGHDKHAPAGNEAGNVRNGTRPQDGADREQRPGRHRRPRDRDGSFEPQIVKKRRRRLSAVATAYKRGLLS
jgi:transposase-like protein